MPSEDILPYSYKELTIPADDNGSFKISERALHVWPRGEFMLIALPNPDGDFTLTLFMPTKGAISFDALRNNIEVEEFFEKFFSRYIRSHSKYIRTIFSKSNWDTWDRQMQSLAS